MVETTKDNTTEKENTTKEKNDPIINKKNEIAEKYIDELKKHKGLITAGIINMSKNSLKDYLVSEGGLDSFWDKIKGNTISNIISNSDKGSFEINGNKYDSISDYLKKAKEKINMANTEEDLKKLEDEIMKSDNKTDQNKTTDQKIDKNIEIGNGKRKDVLDRLDKIIKHDKKNPVKYARGGSTSVNKGLDCSGLIKYTLHQAGIESPGLDSKDMFQNTTTTKLEMNSNKGFANIESYQPGDLLFRNTTNSKYNWKNSKISKIKKDGKEYRIHHVAFIKEIYPDTGKIIIVESNGTEGLIQREIDYDYELNKSAHKSEIFAGKVNYDNLLAYNGTKENIDDKLAA